MAKKWCHYCEKKQKMTKLDSETYKCKVCDSVRVICDTSESCSRRVAKVAIAGVAAYLIAKKVHDSWT